MSTANMNFPTEVCILCLESSENSINIYFPNGQKNTEIPELLTDHFWFDVDELAQYSDLICRNCLEQTKTFHGFFMKIKEVHLNYLNKYHEQTDNLRQATLEIKTEHEQYTEDSDDLLGIYSGSADDQVGRECSSTSVEQLENEYSSTGVDDYSLAGIEHDDNDYDSAKQEHSETVEVIQPPVRSRKKAQHTEIADPEFTTELTNKMLQVFDMSCDVCNQEFNSWVDARTHYPRKHNIVKGYLKCCNRKFVIKSDIIDHIQYHIDPTTFQCDKCPKQFFGRRALASHGLMHLNSEDKLFECYYCRKRYTHKHILKRHYDSAHPIDNTKYTCDVCQKDFKSHHILKYHKLKVHEGIEQRVCDICARVFKTKEGYQSHVAAHMGTVEARKQCNLCGVWLKTQKILNKHIKMHTDLPQKCPFCDKVKHNKTSLSHHIRAVHRVARYPCTICDKTFKRMVALTEHIATHTGANLYTCPYCPKMFKCNANMHKHRKNAHYELWCADRKAKAISRTTNPD